MLRKIFLSVIVMVILSGGYSTVFGHCDTMDGPVVKDAQKAIEFNNVNYVLKWIPAVNEKELIQVFELAMKVRTLSPDAKELADMYFFETLVRIHRNGEGVPYAGIKAAGTPIDEKIAAADKSIEIGNLSPLENFVPKEKFAELKKRFDKVMALKNFDVNNVPAGRKYVEAYVQFFHFAEGGEAEHNHESHNEEQTECEHH